MSTSWLIGSAAGCQIVVGHPTVSGRHCRLTVDGEGYLLEDLGSTNGTYLNGQRLAGPVRITKGDKVTLGQGIPLPWPPEGAGPGPQSATKVLRIGREADNDIVVNLPTVSGYHARVVWEGKPGELIVEDLGSSNGTAVGLPDRKVARAVIAPADTLYLGTHPIPAAQLFARFESSSAVAPATTLAFRGAQAVIGRNADCDHVVDHPSVSGRHARLFRAQDRILVEDLGSTNGTFVGGERVDRPRVVCAGDPIVLGSHALVLVDALDAAPRPTVRTVVEGVAQPAPATALVGSVREPASGPVDLAGELRRTLSQPRPLAFLIAQAPLVALGIVLLSRHSDGSATGGSVLFGLGLASLWFGLGSAGLASTLPPPQGEGLAPGHGVERLAARFLALAALALFQSVVAWAVVASGARLEGSAPLMLALLAVGSLVGLALGLTIVALVPRPAPAWACLLAALLPLWLFGGAAWPLPRMGSGLSVLASVAPSRWMFEALLLLETDPRSAAGTHEPGGVPGSASLRPDMAEVYFPAETHRMGLKADTIALAGMLAGLLGLVAFMAADPPRRARAT